MLMRIETGSRGMAKVGERERAKNGGKWINRTGRKAKKERGRKNGRGEYVYIDNSIAMNRSMAIPMAYNIAIVESYYEQ